MGKHSKGGADKPDEEPATGSRVREVDFGKDRKVDGNDIVAVSGIFTADEDGYPRHHGLEPAVDPRFLSPTGVDPLDKQNAPDRGGLSI